MRFAMFLLHGPTRGARTDDKPAVSFVTRENLKTISRKVQEKLDERRRRQRNSDGKCTTF